MRLNEGPEDSRGRNGRRIIPEVVATDIHEPDNRRWVNHNDDADESVISIADHTDRSCAECEEDCGREEEENGF